MSRPVCFHLDEHVDHAVAKALILRGIDVTTTAGEDLIGATDDHQLRHAAAGRRVLVTADDDLLSVAASVNHAGIAFYVVKTTSIGRLIDVLQLIHGVLDADEMVNHVEHV